MASKLKWKQRCGICDKPLSGKIIQGVRGGKTLNMHPKCAKEKIRG